MKKTLCLILTFVVILTAFAGCSGGKADKPSQAQAAKIDYDLTKVSKNVVYSQINEMIMSPDKYKNKTVKVRGTFDYADDELSGKRHYACIVSDTKGCCEQSLEFVTEKEMSFEEYPVILSEIEVEGTVDTYNIGNTETLVVYLKNAKIKEV